MIPKAIVPLFLMACAACGPQAPGEETEGGSTSTSGTSGGPTSSGPEPTTTLDPGGPTEPTTTPDTMTSGVEPTTGDEGTCPIGQPKLAPVWATVLAPDPKFDMWLSSSPAVLSDGVIAVPGTARTLDEQAMAPGVFWVGADGQPLAWTAGSLEPLNSLEVRGIQVAADDSVVVAGPANDNLGEPLPFIARFAAGGPELTRALLQTTSLVTPTDFELYADDTAVIVGHDSDNLGYWLARVEVATGAVLWEVQLSNAGSTVPAAVAVGPGGEIVVGAGKWPNEDSPELKISRLGADGSLAWDRDLFQPGPHAGQLNDLVVTPDGQIIVLRRWRVPGHKISATSLRLADSNILWDVDLVVETDAGPPALQRAVVDGDAVLLPIARGPDLDSGTADPLTVELHRLSFAGELLDVTPLPLENRESGQPRVSVARGACGDLVLLQEEQLSWLGSFAP